MERLDIVEFGGSPGGGRPGRSWLRWLPLVLVAVVVVALVVRNESERDRFVPPAAHPPTTSGVSPSSDVTAGQATSPAPVVTEVGHPLLGVTGGWKLFGRGGSGVVRIEVARGRVTRTAVPPLASSGPVSFVVGRDWAIVRPLDYVPGYIVPDGRAARALAGALSEGGPALPGPDQMTVWVPVGTGERTTMALVGPDGRPTGASVPIPADTNGFAEPDATGHLLLHGTGGVYLAGPDGLRRVTTGALLALGPTRWLIRECDDHHRCATVVVDRRTGARRTLDTHADQVNGSPGVISPDGAVAALLERGSTGLTAAHLLDLASGADRRLLVPLDQPFGDPGIAWSPDSRWLFIAGADGQLYPVDRATARIHDLGVALPPIDQLAIRDAPR